MAFHTACPITLRKICYCELGFPGKLKERRAREEFLEEVSRVEEFLKDPWTLRSQDDGGGTVQIPVPRLLPPPAEEDEVDFGGGGVEEAAARAAPARGESAWALSVKARREELRQQAAAAREAAEEYIRKLEAGVLLDVPGETANDHVREDQGSSEIQIICRICFSGENESSERAKRMLPCKTCNKKYHRSCLKIWAEYRDLFHWSLWTCPSCRVCQVCRRPGDPTKLMFCKRCDDAYHCYCLQPPHKNVSHGPYLCPKHTWCHSCGSTVSGSGHSTRWFLSYTCCDACGRLFVKGKYCPVCLKVYRDSETTPMVCCDVCQRWVHCVCDGISDEKYQQFQKDGNLYYKCTACRGDCYQVKDTDDAVRELWRRKDKADRDLTARLRSVAGLPTQEEIFSISPFSDDDESGQLKLKNEHGGSLKFSVKGLGDKTQKSSKDFGKTSSPSIKNAKKGHQVRSDGQEILSSPNIGSDIEKPLVDKETSSTKEDVVNSINVNSINMMTTSHKKGTKTQSLHFKEGAARNAGKNETAKGTKLVILLGAKGKNTTTSARPEASSCQREQDFATANGPGDTSHQEDDKNVKLETPGGVDRFVIGEGARLDNAALTTSLEHEERENNVVKLRLVPDMHRKSRTNMAEQRKHSIVQKSPLILREKCEENKDVMHSKQSVGPTINCQSQNHCASDTLLANFPDDSKPLLKLKFKNPYFEQRSSLSSQAVASQGVEMKNAVKGQRSKRKRPSLEKSVGTRDDASYSQPPQKKSIDEVMDANWILEKLGKDAIGKRVEVHQSSDDSWQKGVVSDVIEGGSSLLVHLDDGSPMTFTLGMNGIRFVTQKQKRTKAVVRTN